MIVFHVTYGQINIYSIQIRLLAQLLFYPCPFLPDATCDDGHGLMCWLFEENDSGCRKHGTKVFIWLKRWPRFHMLDPLSPIE